MVPCLRAATYRQSTIKLRSVADRIGEMFDVEIVLGLFGINGVAARKEEDREKRQVEQAQKGAFPSPVATPWKTRRF